MAKRISKTYKINHLAISCHYTPDGKPLCGNSPELCDTDSRAEFVTHEGSCPLCRGKLASLDMVEAATKGLRDVGFPIDGDAVRALRRGNGVAVVAAASAVIAQVERCALSQAIDGVMPTWYSAARSAALAFQSAAAAV